MIFINAPTTSQVIRSMASKLEQWRLLRLIVVITAMTKFLVDVTFVVGNPLLFVTNLFFSLHKSFLPKESLMRKIYFFCSNVVKSKPKYYS